MKRAYKIIFLMGLTGFFTRMHAEEVKIFLIRHGQTDWNLQERVQGHTDIPLNETGLKQARELAQKLIAQHPDIKAIYSSDLQRAYVTALETARLFNLTVTPSEALREIYCGESEGMLFSERNAKYQEAWEELCRIYTDHRERGQYTSVPGAETVHQLITRMKGELVSPSSVASRPRETFKLAVI